MTFKLTWHGKEAKAAARKGAMRGLQLGAEHVLQVSTTIVPIEEHTLQASGVPSTDSFKLMAAVSYDTPYAVRQHEDLTMRHDEGRHAKYLEIPLVSESAVVNKLLAREIKKELKS